MLWISFECFDPEWVLPPFESFYDCWASNEKVHNKEEWRNWIKIKLDYQASTVDFVWNIKTSICKQN